MTIKAPRKKYYVYIHKYASGPKEGNVFYVGKGSAKRAGSSYGRSEYWHRIKSKYGFVYEIAKRFDNEICAYSFEKILVGFYGRGNLCNLTDGGDGSFNPTQETRDKISRAISGSKHYKFKDDVIRFCHPDHGPFDGTMYAFYTKYNLSHKDVYHLVYGNRMTVKGWMIGEIRDIDRAINLRGDNHYKYDKAIYEFRNGEGDIFIGTQYEFRKKFDLPQASVWQLVNGGVHTAQGWWIGDNKPKRKVRDCSNHSFLCSKNKVHTGRIKHLSIALNVSETSLCSLRDGRAKSIKGITYIQPIVDHPPISFAA
jgi:hypothetical protein